MTTLSEWIVYVPDRSTPYRFPGTMAVEEVRASLVATGHTALENADVNVDGQILRFRRVTGGNKGNQ